MKSNQVYGDREVMAALNNAVVSLVRWDKLGPSLRDNPTRLRSFAEGIVDTIRDALTVVVAGGRSLSLTDAETALCLQLAVLMTVLESDDLLPADSHLRTLFAGSLVKERNKRDIEKEIPDVFD